MITRESFTFSDRLRNLTSLVAVFSSLAFGGSLTAQPVDRYSFPLDREAPRWKTDPEVKAFFHQECIFSNGQLARFEKYLSNAAATMQSRRTAGKLFLDLDLDDFFKPERS